MNTNSYHDDDFNTWDIAENAFANSWKPAVAIDPEVELAELDEKLATNEDSETADAVARTQET